MKKITLLLLLFCSFLGYSQLETFEGGIPANWKVMTGINGLGAAEMWKLNTTAPASPYTGYGGTGNAAYVNNINVGQGNTEEDWLIMNQRTVPANGRLRFFVRQTQAGNQQTQFEIRVSTNPVQDNQAAYEVLESFTEGQLNNLNGDISQYEEKVINLDDYIGQAVYVAFVRVFTQPNPGRAGERFLVDNVNILTECGMPTALDVPIATVYSTSAVLTWSVPAGVNSFEIEVVPANQEFTGTGTIYNGLPPYTKTGLTPETTYKYCVKSRCQDNEGNFYTSSCSGEFFFTTLPVGSVCYDPLVVNALPYQVASANTLFYGDQFDTIQGTGCGALPASTNYLDGNEVYYSYTPDQSGNISIIMTPLGGSLNSSLFIYSGACTSVGSSCIAGVANANGTPRIVNLAVTAGQTYYIVISSSNVTPSINYSLLIQRENCLPKPANLTASNPVIVGTDAGITLGWDNPGGYTSFQVQVQPVNSPIPTGPGSDNIAASGANITFNKTGLNAATIYQFWVRAECTFGSGIYTSWSGPFVFNTLVCDPLNTCPYIFRLTDSGNNGWGANRMQVRQNEIVIATLGTEIATGSGPIDVLVPMCPGVPFDLFWSAAGANPGQCGVTIINSFSQTLYTKPLNLNAPNTILFADNVKCDAPRCDLTPTNLLADITLVTTSSATLSWAANGMTEWEIYIVEAGSPAPDANTVPTYTNVTDNPFETTISLLADTAFDFYVRVPCSPFDSQWGGPGTFKTLPTCYKPTLLSVDGITKNSATFKWTNGQPTDNSWEILLIPGPDAPPPPPINPSITGGTILFATTDPSPYNAAVGSLTPATIYYYYIRTVCPGDDKSTWSGPIKFNTVTCDDIDKCNYKFVLTNTTGNSWNNGRMQVRQNGILITTLGTSLINNANGVSVGLCPNVSFELVWTVPGTLPGNIGISVQNPFLDVIYTKLPGTGTPGVQLYQAITNCTPAPCSKPTGMAVSEITSSSAKLTWTDNSIPASTAYDLYVVTTGSPAPTNNPSTTPTISGVSSGYILNTLNGVTPLLPSTSYTFYVRAVCVSPDTSTWTILTPITFVTRPINDECTTAFPVVVSSTQECTAVNLVHGHTFGASQSQPIPASNAGGCGATDDDIWFSFVATNASQTITFTNIVSTPATVRINHTLYSGTCDNLTQMYCFQNNSSIALGLTVGETYYVRVYTPGTNLAQHVEFDICITSPPVNDDCANAITIPTHPTRVCTTPTPVNTLGATASLPAATPGTGCGTVNDDMWYSFVATSTIHLITISNVTGDVTDINHTLYSGNECGTLTQLYCSNPDKSVANNLTIGNTYKIRVYTAGSNTWQSAKFDLCVTTPPPVLNDNCENAQVVTVNYGLDCAAITPVSLTGATASPQTSICPGTEDDDIWFEFTANSTSQEVSFSNVQGTITVAGLSYSFYKGGDCGAMTFMYCGSGETFVATNLIIGDTYKIRIWTTVNTIQDVTFDLCIIRLPPPIFTSDNKYYPSNVTFTIPDLVDDILIDADSQCAEASNVTWRTGTAQGFNGIGYFHKRFSDFPIEEGVVLSTGRATSAGGSNSSDLSEGDGFPITWLGDTEIEDVIAASTLGLNVTTNNASVLEFDFVPSIDQISFPFIFAAEEYGQYQCDFTDAFIFILTNTITNEKINVALVPGTNDPVTVQTVRDQLYNTGCASANADQFDKFYDNDIGVNILAAPVNFNGVTKMMTAKAQVVPNTPYHIKLAIADTGDGAFDSAIFIGKFTIGSPPDLPDDLLLANGNPVCDGEPLTLDPSIQNPELYEIEWLRNGVTYEDANGVDITTPTAVVTTSGTYTVNITKIGGPDTCVQTDSIVIEYYDDLTAGTPIDLIKCNATGSATFDLTENATAILLPFTDPHTLTYFKTPEDAAGNIIENAILTPDDFLANNGQMIYVRVAHNVYGCDQVVSFKLIVQDLTPQFEFSGEMNVCPEAQTTISIATINNNFDLSQVTFKWFHEGVEIVGQTAATITLPIMAPTALPLYGNYSAIVNNSGCTKEEFFVISQNTVPWDIVVTQVPTFLCPTEPGTLAFSVANAPAGETITYTLTNPGLETAQNQTGTFNIVGPGLYTVDVDILGCLTPLQITIAPSVSSWNATFDGSYEICGNETVNISFTGVNFNANNPAATYTWTLPDGSQLNGLVLNNMSQIGDYTLNISIYGCSNDNAIKASVVAGTSNWQITPGGPYVICAGQSVDLSFTAVNFNISDPNAVYTWTRPDGTQFTGPVLNANQIGDYDLNVTIDGCGNDVPSIAVTQNPNAISVGFESGCEGQDFIVRAIPINNSFDPQTATFDWTGSDFKLIPGEPDAVILSGTSGVSVQVSFNGCESPVTAASLPTNIGCTIQKGISPNNDGKNDFFDLSGYDVKHLGIFNRYGTEVYQRSNYVKEWNGQSNSGDQLTDGTYFYVIDLVGGGTKTGWIYLNR